MCLLFARFQKMNQLFECNDTDDVNATTLTFNERTYVVRATSWSSTPDVVASCEESSTTSSDGGVEPRQLLAFNGSRYLIVSRSRTMYIVALVEGRYDREAKIRGAMRLLHALSKRLICKSY